MYTYIYIYIYISMMRAEDNKRADTGDVKTWLE